MEKETAITLSPAAQAVKDAAYTLPIGSGLRSRIVAALRAAADQCVYTDDYGTEYICPADIRAIAAELEAQ